MNEKDNIMNANEIVLQNKIGEELALIKTTPQELQSSRFKELIMNSEILGGAVYGLSNLSQTLNISTEGLNLFKSTASISQLKTYGDQTFSSMLAGEGGQILRHAGFEKLDTFSATVSNPVVPLVILTTVIIKQQFEELNRKLDTITDRLNSVIGMMHAEKYSK